MADSTPSAPAAPNSTPAVVESVSTADSAAKPPREEPEDKDNWRKRKAEFQESRMQHGSRRNGKYDGRRHPKGDLGRTEYFRDSADKRRRMDEAREQRERDGIAPLYGKEFSKEEIDSEERRPKRKVAVFIGYSGTGYKGMQITPEQRTIEGDLFKAFIDAGAISKANADDPKKAGLVRCARTDKGVHAAGNMISLKLIVEDEDIVEKINSHLSPQIRMWGFERTTGSFSCYQACDSRWYEYLIPSHAFLPPHPSSWLAKTMEESAQEVGDLEQYRSRQAEVQHFWQEVEEKSIRSILDGIDEDIRFDVVKALQGEDEAYTKTSTDDAKQEVDDDGITDGSAVKEAEISNTEVEQADGDGKSEATKRMIRLRLATKQLRAAYIDAKRRFRIPQSRIERIQAVLSKYVGTANFHNFTIQKSYKDASAKRHIKSFVVNPKPILIGEGPDGGKSEWLSIKVHGQSFMMHQIRKMIGLTTLVVRCGTDLSIVEKALGPDKLSIPKVPGLGLLLERPVFDTYNNSNAKKYDRSPLLFSKYEKEIEEFKEKEIYQRIFREEEEKNEFHKFFNHIDNFKETYFLYVTSKGIEATKGAHGNGGKMIEIDGSDDEAGGDD